MRVRLRRGATVLATALLMDLALTGPAADAAWRDGAQEGPWQVVFTGYGEVSGSASAVTLAPMPPENDGATHAALVATRRQYGDGSLQVRVQTVAQLRAVRPNPWEVGWVLWHYQDTAHFYAVALKPNGWEVSKQDPAYPMGQRFLATGSSPAFPVGRTYAVEVTQDGNHQRTTVDGRQLAVVTDTERPYLSGSVALYCEDARVQFTDLRILTPTSGQQKGDR